METQDAEPKVNPIHSLNKWDFFPVSTAIVVAGVSKPTFTKKIEDGVLYEPQHLKKVASVRKYYTLQDLMIISIVSHGAIKMGTLRSVLLAKNVTQNVANNMIIISLKRIQDYIKLNRTYPIDLKPYLETDPIIDA